MSVMAMVVPILPGKAERWQRLIDELKGPRRQQYQESRRRLGVRERIFRQSTPQGDLLVITLEGDDPEGAMRRFAKDTDEFSRWFFRQMGEINGPDAAQGTQGPPQLVVDSDSSVEQQAA